MAANGAPESWDDEEPRVAQAASAFKNFNLDDLEDFVPSFVPAAAVPAFEAPAPVPEPAPAPVPAVVDVPKPAPVAVAKAATVEPQSPSPVTRSNTDSSQTALSGKAAALAEKEAALLEKEDAEHKEMVNIVFIGHVDAGKSTMGGHILYLTGMVDKRTMEKFEKEAKEIGRDSWYLSWALDANSEERAKVNLRH